MAVHSLLPFVAAPSSYAPGFSSILGRHEAAPLTHQDQDAGDAPPSPLPYLKGPENRWFPTVSKSAAGPARRQFYGLRLLVDPALRWLTVEASSLKTADAGGG